VAIIIIIIVSSNLNCSRQIKLEIVLAMIKLEMCITHSFITVLAMIKLEIVLAMIKLEIVFA
jgi:hypothetical protein